MVEDLHGCRNLWPDGRRGREGRREREGGRERKRERENKKRRRQGEEGELKKRDRKI